MNYLGLDPLFLSHKLPRFLSENPQEELSFFLRLESTGYYNVGARDYIKPGMHFSGIGETSRVSFADIVVNILLSEFVTSIFRSLLKQQSC